jgi:hypothetical protein
MDLRKARGGADIEERIPKVVGSDVRNRTCQPVNFSSKSAIPTKSSSPNADALGRGPIAVPFGRASTQAIPRNFPRIERMHNQIQDQG